MKGLFIFENKCMRNEFPFEVTTNCGRYIGVKGKVFFKSEEAEKIEREKIDNTIGLKIAGRPIGLSDMMYVPVSFVRSGSNQSEPFPPMCVWFDYEGEKTYLYTRYTARTTAIRNDTGEEIPVHVVPFSSEESETEWELRSGEEQKEILTWEPVFLME